ncbi:MAG: discoidin domain-containing protein, partial [Armatimonadetes bacterium]|nr:discoidin domain-containing protein [Armatimonadota bacterium]
MSWSVALLILSSCFGQQGEEPRNIALGRPYKMSPPPNYSYCTDPNDSIQLTDGEHVTGYFWTQKGTVGWRLANLVDITIDLGEVKSISGVSLRTAAGVAAVYWPSQVLVFVSDDGNSWFRLCDLVSDHDGPPLPPYGTYAEAILRKGGLKAHGRWVRVIIVPVGSYA